MLRKNMLRKIFTLTLLTVLLFGCAPAVTPQVAPTIGATQTLQVQTEAPTAIATATSAAITLTDDLGRTVTLKSSRTTNRFAGSIEHRNSFCDWRGVAGCRTRRFL